MTVEAKELDSIRENEAVVLCAQIIDNKCDNNCQLSEQDAAFAMRFLLVSPTLDNGQWLGLAINMTSYKYDEREFAPDGSAIIYVAKHVPRVESQQKNVNCAVGIITHKIITPC